MTTRITPTHIMTTEPLDDSGAPSIFLAGPTPRDPHTPSWRPAAIAALRDAGHDGVIYDPEDRGGWNGDYDDRIDWEHAALSAADTIAFWIPRELTAMPAFTTNVEFGYWIDSGKVVAGGPPDAPKNRYLAATAARHGVDWHDTLERTMAAALAHLAQRTGRPTAAR
jgi:hypothetical protein